MARTLLTNHEIEHLLASLPEWSLQARSQPMDEGRGHPADTDGDPLLSRNSSIQADYAFESYAQAVAFAVAVALRAEAQNHHPTLLLKYEGVSVRTTTHDTGGLTDRDSTLAFAVRSLADAMGGTSRKTLPAI